MHTTEDIRRTPISPGIPVTVTRVAVAGVTGYAGQELLRLLARHPAVTVTAAMSSAAAGPTGSHAPTPSSRRLPALTRVWDRSVVPVDRDTLARGADGAVLATPDSGPA